MSYFSTGSHNAIIATPSLVNTYFSASAFGTDLGPANTGGWMDTALIAGAYASVIANDIKPYGPELPSYDLTTLLNEPSLACDAFAALTCQFMKLIPASAGLNVRVVGWDNGPETTDPVCPVGNHAQMFINSPAGSLLLDPTIGLVVKTNYTDVARGIPVDMTKSKCFTQGFSTDPVKLAFAVTVKNALAAGTYRPCHALYYYKSIDTFLGATAPLWVTPAGSKFQ